MPIFNIVSLVSNIAKGYGLSQALKLISACGFDCVEIASIGGMCEHIAVPEMTDDYAQKLTGMLKNENLSAYAFSGHVDLTDDDGADDFLKKMSFAASIGCRIINTNSGPADQIGGFRRNLKKIIDCAERLNITVCLESHGDIVGEAKQAAALFRDINHPLIRMNYDTGNTYYYAKGKVAVADDILYALDYLAYVHIKDVRIDGDSANYCALGEGGVGLYRVFDALKQLGRPLPCGLEIPVFVSGTLERLSSAGAPIPEAEIYIAVDKSMKYLKQTGVI